MAFESTRGKLAQKDFDCIQDNFVYLKDNLEARDLVDYLFQQRVILLEDKQKISSAKTKPERNDLLLTILLHAGPGPNFNHFLSSLEGKYPQVLETLKRTDKSNPKKRKSLPDISGEIDERTQAVGSKKAKTVSDVGIESVNDGIKDPEERAQTEPPKKRKYTKRAKSLEVGVQQIKTPRPKSAKVTVEELKAKDDQISQLKEENEQIKVDLQAKNEEICLLKEENEKFKAKDEEIRQLKEENEKLKAKDEEIRQLKEENEMIAKAKEELVLQLKENGNFQNQDKNFMEMKLNPEEEMCRLIKELEKATKEIKPQYNEEMWIPSKEKEKSTVNPNEVKKKEKKMIRLISREDFQKCVELILRKRGKDSAGIKDFWLENWLVKGTEGQPGTSREKSQVSKLNRIELLKAKYKSWEINRQHKQTEGRNFWKNYDECQILTLD